MPQVRQQVGGELEAEARQTLNRFRTALARVLAQVPGAGQRPATVARALGLHKSLARKFAQIVANPDPFATVQLIPGEAGIEILLRAAAERGASRAALDGLRDAAAEYRRLMDSYAGDRASLQLTISGLSRRPASPVELGLRRNGFRCASYVWGVQCRASIKTVVLHPSGDPDRVHVASIRGRVDLRRLRTGVSWPLSRRYRMEPAENESAPYTCFDTVGGPDGIPLLLPFCTSPLPEIIRQPLAPGETEFRLAPGPIGAKAAMTCFMGDVAYDAGRRWSESSEEDVFFNTCQMRTPMESVVVDTFVHRDLWPGELRPAAMVVSELTDDNWAIQVERGEELLPCPERVEEIGMGTAASHCPEYPRYAELMDYSFEKLGWRADEFRLFRLRIEYPVLRTAALVRFELPRRPG